MGLILENRNVKLFIDKPGENYHFSRFDSSGKITGVFYRGVQLTSCELYDCGAVTHKGRGLYNEFGIDKAIGHNAIPNGELFHKIGVGELIKEQEEYDFYKSYNFTPVSFKVSHSDTRYHVSSQSRTLNGYAYAYEKEIRLSEQGFVILYTLKNTGEKNIITNEYNHNFLAFNKQAIGPDYELEFNFTVNRSALVEVVNPANCITIEGNKIQFLSEANGEFFFSNLCPAQSIKAGFTVSNKQCGLALSEYGNFSTSKINLWGAKHVISPEIFIDIALKPGESQQWQRNYTITEL